jgi:hypothetical protein
MLAAIKDYKEWRSYKVPVGQAIRLTWKSKMAVLVK